MKRQINYMVFSKPHGSRVWTSVTDDSVVPFGHHANMFGKKETAEKVASSMIDEYGGAGTFTIFECREVGFTATLS